MEKRLFETKNHAEIYAKYRVVPPIELIARIVQYLKEKVSHLNVSMYVLYHSF